MESKTERLGETRVMNCGKTVDEITDDDFCEYVGDKVSIEENVYQYDGSSKEVTRYRTTELEG